MALTFYPSRISTVDAGTVTDGLEYTKSIDVTVVRDASTNQAERLNYEDGTYKLITRNADGYVTEIEHVLDTETITTVVTRNASNFVTSLDRTVTT